MGKWICLTLGLMSGFFLQAGSLEFFGLCTLVPSQYEEAQEHSLVQIDLEFMDPKQTPPVVSSYLVNLDDSEADVRLLEVKERILDAVQGEQIPYQLSACLRCSQEAKDQLVSYLEEEWSSWEPDLFEEISGNQFSFPSMQGWDISTDSDLQALSEEGKPFFALPLTNEDKKNIRDLVFSLADKNIVQLLIEKKLMDKKGDKIRKVHPLRFAAFILTDPHMKKCIKAVEKDSLKWSHFVAGYEEKMKEEAKGDRLMKYAPGFAEYMQASLEEVQMFIASKDYGGLLKRFL